MLPPTEVPGAIARTAASVESSPRSRPSRTAPRRTKGIHRDGRPAEARRHERHDQEGTTTKHDHGMSTTRRARPRRARPRRHVERHSRPGTWSGRRNRLRMTPQPRRRPEGSDPRAGRSRARHPVRGRGARLGRDSRLGRAGRRGPASCLTRRWTRRKARHPTPPRPATADEEAPADETGEQPSATPEDGAAEEAPADEVGDQSAAPTEDSVAEETTPAATPSARRRGERPGCHHQPGGHCERRDRQPSSRGRVRLGGAPASSMPLIPDALLRQGVFRWCAAARRAADAQDGCTDPAEGAAR